MPIYEYSSYELECDVEGCGETFEGSDEQDAEETIESAEREGWTVASYRYELIIIAKGVKCPEHSK